MKKLFNILIVSAIIAAGVVGVKLQNEKTIKPSNYSSLVLANLNALLDTETEGGSSDPEVGRLDTNYTRKAKNCEFKVGANVQVHIFGIGVLKAGADGIISVPEQVTCIARGNETCRPVECIEILKLISNPEKV